MNSNIWIRGGVLALLVACNGGKDEDETPMDEADTDTDTDIDADTDTDTDADTDTDTMEETGTDTGGSRRRAFGSCTWCPTPDRSTS